MTKTKSNVFLHIEVADNTSIKPCGMWHIDYLSEILKTISKLNLPADTCVYELSGTLIQSVFNANGAKKRAENPKWTKKLLPQNNQQLIIRMTPDLKHAPCKAKSGSDCFNCIAKGKCKDIFITDLLGKKLFSDKYTNKK